MPRNQDRTDIYCIKIFRPLILLITGAIFVNFQYPASRAIAADQAKTITWDSRNQNFRDLAGSFDKLYATLSDIIDAGGGIAKETYPIAKGQLVKSLANEKKLYDGNYFPPHLDRLLCLLNAHICKLDFERKSGGNQIPKGRWRYKSGDLITIPKVSFDQYVTFQPYSKRKGDSIAQIVVKDRKGCPKFDQICENYVKNLNQNNLNLMDLNSAGTILVPTRAYRGQIVVRDFGESPNSLTPDDYSKKIFEPLKKMIVPRGTIELQGVAKKCPAPAERALMDRVFELVGYEDKIPIRFNTLSAVLDRRVFVQHCLYHPDIIFVATDDRGVASRRSPETIHHWQSDIDSSTQSCGTYGASSRSRDHGTHIVGTINSFLEAANSNSNETGNAAARNYSIIAYQLPAAATSESQAGLEVSNAEVTLTNIILENKSDTVNLSLAYYGNGHAVESAGLPEIISRVAERTRSLFVVAAGNRHSDGSVRVRMRDDEKCDVWPACSESRNLISVVALNLSKSNPEILETSNWGTAFDIAAPGKSIVSTIGNHRLGCMEGTSQATAIVSAAAATLYSQNQNLSSAIVKNRLIYSSDLFATLYGRVFGGRINLGAALGYDADSILLDNETIEKGTVILWPAMQPGITSPFVNAVNGKISSVTWNSLRRLKRMSDSVYRAFYLTDKNDEGSELKDELVSFRSQLIADQSIKLSMRTASSHIPVHKRIRLGDIVDFVSRIRQLR